MRPPIGLGEIAAQCYLDGKMVGKAEAMNIDRTAKWELRCLEPRCHYSREFGTAQFECKRAASAHQRRRPTHRVQIWVCVEDRNPIESMDPLSLAGVRTDDAPF